ncbi:hypothetical protein OIK40_11165 [Erythrobacter sp. sf7]|uniref:Inovirus Gp2 family protein n=1 Tax=Erythrobacter fulvus TaxID=2987523 RepID=A0ABT5JR01_9SPHN|nr:hypothetical protein [Erythrobacter fulvus]MDC8755198.1 hypothetical protein [Erythrobacter fulvus]
MRAGLARVMQLCSYGPSQPPADKSRIPRTRERKAANATCESNTRACERENLRTYKKGDAHSSPAKGKANFPAPKKGTWGGARNRRDRVTTALKQGQAEGILKALATADLKGLPLTRHWTVDYERAGISDRDGAAFVGRLLVFVSRYARVRGGSFAAVWVREVGVRNGAHVHIAFHLPRGWRLGYLTRRWIKAAGGQYSKGVSRISPIGGSVNCAWTSPALYRENLERLGNYFTKGSDSTVAAELGLDLLKPGGAIVGKRWGRTQNLRVWAVQS